MRKTVYQFASDEVEAALLILNTAINHHRIWFDSLHTSIVCGLPFSNDILHDAAHKHCEFGKWYYGDVCESISSIREFSALEPVHTYMHSHARDLAIIASQNKKISVDDYHAFLTNQRHLIDLLTKLRDTLIEHEHCFDAVTGAVNRKSISLLLEQTFENAQRYNQVYSIAMLDIDHFKKINDQFGHIAGDHVLEYICEFYRETLRKSDCIGRYGGEEFLIILPETSQDVALELMNNARKNMLKQKTIIGKTPVEVTVSIGVSEVRPEDDNAWQAVERADEALYQAKESGRDCVKKYL